ncbi:cell division topological specificity factor MinE, partial [Candidatus Poribacteria bacterium]|nr:cell division topological specificity factor MinE [Candidatus Poribacteria bacterium]
MNISIKQLFGRKPKSSSIAKQRLKLVITQDRFDVDDRVMTRLHHELAEVLAKYFEFSANSVK